MGNSKKWNFRFSGIFLIFSLLWLVVFVIKPTLATYLFIYFTFFSLLSFQLFLYGWFNNQFSTDKNLAKSLLTYSTFIPVLIHFVALFDPVQLETSWPLLLSIVFVQAAMAFLVNMGFITRKQVFVEKLIVWITFLIVLLFVFIILLKLSFAFLYFIGIGVLFLVLPLSLFRIAFKK